MLHDFFFFNNWMFSWNQCMNVHYQNIFITIPTLSACMCTVTRLINPADGHRYHAMHRGGDKKRRGSERDIDHHSRHPAAKRQRHVSEPDYKERVLLQLTQQTLHRLKTGVASILSQLGLLLAGFYISKAH